MPPTHSAALIIIAHGSRLSAANDEFFQLVEAVGTSTGAYQWTLPAFLEAAQPTLLQACDKAIALGASRIDVYPLFFNQGRHVGKDIPALVAEAMDQHPERDIRLLDYFGSHPGMAESICTHLQTQSPD